MELALRKLEYTEAGAITKRGCLHVVPGEHTRTGEKVAVGNVTGELRVFGANKTNNSLEDAYRVPAFNQSPVECMRLAVVPDKDKVAIFVGGKSSAEEHGDVRAFSKRSKTPFIDFTTRMSDPVSHLDVYQHDLFTATDGYFNHFYNCQEERGSFAPPHEINDVSYISMDGILYPVLGCEDRLLRVLGDSTADDGGDGFGNAKETVFEVELPGKPRCLLPFNELGQPRKELLYGTRDGRLGLTAISRTKIRQRFCHPNEKKKGSIDTLAVYDLDEDGLLEIVVGRSDGKVDVFRTERGSTQPTLCAQHEFSESISSVSCGKVGSEQHHDIMLATYSGRIISLNTDNDPLSQSLPSPSGKKKKEIAGDSVQRMEALRKEIAALEAEVNAKKKECADELTKESSAVEYIAEPYVEFHDDFSFQEGDANYLLVIESQVALDFILLRSDTTMDILDVEKNTLLPSQCAPDHENKTLVSYTFRCQANTRRVEFKLRPIEGQEGNLSVLVSPSAPLNKMKVARELTYPIKPLCLHSIVHVDESDRPFSTLKYAGKATIGVIHRMLYSCLAGLNDKPRKPKDADSICMVYRSAITRTIVRITYKENELLLESDNISTLSILKEYLYKIIQKDRMQMQFSHSLNIDAKTVPWMLNLINERICHQIALQQKLHLWQALKEVELSEGPGSITSPEYKEIMENGEEIRKETEAANSLLERLFGTITDLYIDFYRMKGVDSKKHINGLLQLLDNYNLETLLEFFQKDPENASLWTA